MSEQRTFDLGRFLDAQRSTFEQARAELSAGEKRSHWMWFIFPQIQGLGSSAMAQRFAISGLEEATAYLDHSVLGARLREYTSLVLANSHRSVTAIFGYPDDLKFHSCMTLFAQAGMHSPVQNELFTEALGKFFDGKLDRATMERLA